PGKKLRSVLLVYSLFIVTLLFIKKSAGNEAMDEMDRYCMLGACGAYNSAVSSLILSSDSGFGQKKSNCICRRNDRNAHTD
ncbi:MAG: hypothetical protein M0Q53_21380, partial [Prolixibacteraceae bacterium]|nr:hypothetical protein [Prolixibacteraceae bacterium]